MLFDDLLLSGWPLASHTPCELPCWRVPPASSQWASRGPSLLAPGATATKVQRRCNALTYSPNRCYYVVWNSLITLTFKLKNKNMFPQEMVHWSIIAQKLDCHSFSFLSVLAVFLLHLTHLSAGVFSPRSPQTIYFPHSPATASLRVTEQGLQSQTPWVRFHMCHLHLCTSGHCLHCFPSKHV